MAFRRVVLTWIIGAALVAARPAAAGLVYWNNFSTSVAGYPTTGVGANWSYTGGDLTLSSTSPTAQKFLGWEPYYGLGAGKVTLDLTNLPSHDTVTVYTDLYIIRSWDGNDGRDFWRAYVTDGPLLLDTTFAQWYQVLQSYPTWWASGVAYPGGTGAYAWETLGYYYGDSRWGDTSYRLSWTFSSTASTLGLNFEAPALEGINNESWGLDNFSVYVSGTGPSSVPEPATFALFAFGLVAAGVHRRHRRRPRAHA